GTNKTAGGTPGTSPVKTGSVTVTTGSTAPTGSIKPPGKAAIIVSDNQNGSIIPAPDLSVSANDIGFNPNPPSANTSLTSMVGVRNLGKGDARGVRILCTLFADGKEAEQREFITNINAGGFDTAKWSIIAPSGRQLRLDVLVIADQDPNRKNNQATISVHLWDSTHSVARTPTAPV